MLIIIACHHTSTTTKSVSRTISKTQLKQRPHEHLTTAKAKKDCNRMPTIRVLLFAAAREAAGNVTSVDLELEEGAADTGVLRCVCPWTGVLVRAMLLCHYCARRYKYNKKLSRCESHPTLPLLVLSLSFRMSLAEKFPKLAPLVSNEEYITLALNEEYVPKGSVLQLKAGDVVALIPPISGG